MAAIQRVCAGMPGSGELWSLAAACAPSALRSCALAGRAVLDHHRPEAEFHLNRASAAAAQDGQQQGGPVGSVLAGLTAALFLDRALGEQAVLAATAGLTTAGGDRGIERWLTRLAAEGRCYAEGPHAALRTLSGVMPPPDAPSPGGAAMVVAMASYRVLAGQPGQAADDLTALLSTAGPAIEPGLALRAHQWLALAYHLLGAWHEAAEQAASAAGSPAPQGAAGPERTAHQQEARAAGATAALAAMVAAHRGDWPAAEQWLRAASAHLADHPDGSALTAVAQATLGHARGALTTARHALASLAERADDAARKYRCLWLPLQAEALVESGSRHDAASVLAELQALSEHVPFLRVAHARLSGRLAERRRDAAGARRCYETGLELPAECLAVPVQIGLLEQRYGELLLGLGDSPAATAWLARARSHFEAAGALPYAQRCAASPGSPARAARAAGRSRTLTDRERTVAGLVAAGLTNRQVAARLYVSVKAIEYHLAQIYGKLGITSRRELRGLVEPAEDGGPR